MSIAINDPAVAVEVAALHEKYEAALASNDVATLIGFFWDSPDALRFGVSESLYGANEINEFRRNRPPIDLSRENSRIHIVTLGSDSAVVTLEFDRRIKGTLRHGRQTQVWHRFEDGWKVVSAHVSLVPQSYLDEASALIGLPIPAEYRPGVQVNLERSALIAQTLLAYQLDEAVEAAPVFEP